MKFRKLLNPVDLKSSLWTLLFFIVNRHPISQAVSCSSLVRSHASDGQYRTSSPDSWQRRRVSIMESATSRRIEAVEASNPHPHRQTIWVETRCMPLASRCKFGREFLRPLVPQLGVFRAAA